MKIKSLSLAWKKNKAQKLLEKRTICVEFCLELAHFTWKCLGSILMVSQEVCLEFFLELIILKVSNKTWRSGGFETRSSHLYLWCMTGTWHSPIHSVYFCYCQIKYFICVKASCPTIHLLPSTFRHLEIIFQVVHNLKI